MAATGAPLFARLRVRLPEIEDAAFARVQAISATTLVRDPEYVTSLRSAVSVALVYVIGALETDDWGPPPIPNQLRLQARRAARNGIGLETVLRRYFAGHMVLEDFIMQEAERDDMLATTALKQMLRREAALVESMIAAVSAEHADVSLPRSQGGEGRRAEQVRKLLAGELVELDGLGYELNGWHLAAIASGPSAQDTLRCLAGALERRILLLDGGSGAVWAWLGGRERIEACEALAAVAPCPADVALALGEAGQSLIGWRRSHRQALAAWPVVTRRRSGAVRYADVALLATALSNDLLASTLYDAYLAPLESERDGGKASRDTLAAYFKAGRNASSAAALLGISRKTVSARLRTIEERLDRTLDSCAAELETALRLGELGA